MGCEFIHWQIRWLPTLEAGDVLDQPIRVQGRRMIEVVAPGVWRIKVIPVVADVSRARPVHESANDGGLAAGRTARNHHDERGISTHP